MSGEKCCEIALVKDILGIDRTDTKFDELLTNMVIMVSDLAEKYCNRQFLKVARTDYFESDESDAVPRVAQRLYLDGFPVDLGETFTLTYAAALDRSDEVTLTKDTDYRVDSENGIVIINYATTFNSEGFKVTYTGGYDLSVDPGGGPAGLDYDVIQVGEGLKHFIAQKVAKLHKSERAIGGKTANRVVTVDFTKEELTFLRAYRKKNIV